MTNKLLGPTMEILKVELVRFEIVILGPTIYSSATRLDFCVKPRF
jgi:hypothetical protein